MTSSATPLYSIYSNGFLRVAACIPRVRVAAPQFNLSETLKLARKASASKAAVAIFPELGISGYSNDDLFFQDALLQAVEGALRELRDASRTLAPVIIVGAPFRFEGALYNCPVVIHRGRLLGAVPKLYLPNYREFYEKRQFTSGLGAPETIRIGGETAPFGSDLIFAARRCPDFALHIEICEDLWVPAQPSSFAAMAGATLLSNLSASNATIGKADYRRLLCASQSGRCVAAYIYAAAGYGESTTDLAWDGHALIYENGERIAESVRFAAEPQIVTADIDLDRLRQERARLTSFHDCQAAHRERSAPMRRIEFDFVVPKGKVPLQRSVARFPFVPSDPATCSERCREAYEIQVQGLARRMQATGLERFVIGVSGGLDSAQALMVCAKTVDRLGLARANVEAVTMPGFATTPQSRENAWQLMRALGTSAREIDIRPSSTQMLEDIGHLFAGGAKLYDRTFENVQAGERTSHLFRLANLLGGIVVGTGNLSELALGYTTYGVGDQMAHYNVNASIPKTLIRHLIRWVAESDEFAGEVQDALKQVLAAAYSPELVPPPKRAVRPSWRRPRSAPTSCRISISTTPAVMATCRARSHSLRTMPGPIGYAARGPRTCRPMRGVNTTWRRSRTGLRCFSSASLRPASSSGRRCPTDPKSAPAVHSHRAVTGAPRATRAQRLGSTSSAAHCRQPGTDALLSATPLAA